MKRKWSMPLLAITVISFLVIVFILLRAYVLPSADWFLAGAAADFPAGDQPVLLRLAPPVYIVNLHGEFLALSAKDPHPLGQIVEWHEREARFIDPLTGSNYFLDGSFDPRFLPDGPEPMDLVRLPVKVEDGKLWIRLPDSD